MPTMNAPFSEVIRIKTANAAETQRTTNAQRVLIVEDEAMIAMLLAEVLTELGHEICATEATEAGAIAAAAQHHPDLMIVDEWLRQGSGISAVEKIIRSGFIPHIFVTGDSLNDRMLNPGAVVLQKPFILSELVWAIKSALATTGTIPADPQAH
jgi:two-component system, response regulator PdtaR